jgi:ATP-dependent RNA helicase RhlE
MRQAQGSPHLRVLVLSPTRELAAQIGESFRTYGRFTPIVPITIFGGVNQNPQIDRLRRGADILVATPGRLLDLMGQGYVRLD